MENSKKEKKSLYRRVVPKFIREPIDDWQKKKTILNYYKKKPEGSLNNEEIEAINFLKRNKFCVFPYLFTRNYNRKNIIVYKDEEIGLKYVLLNNKRLYFKRKSSTRGIKRNFTNLLIEQDINSPHRYLTENFKIDNDSILVDVGTAEGNLPLSVIEKVKKVYLFETDENWIEALQATFLPWKEKVEIINKFVSDGNSNTTISLDDFFANKEKISFLKVDVEGEEEKVLAGAAKLISTSNHLKIAICCYHKPNDELKFYNYLAQKNFTLSFAKGYMIFPEQSTFLPPYLRRGVLRAEK